MKILLAVLFCVVAVECVSFMEVLREEWEDFKAEHGKRYNEKLEEKFRMKIFMENKLKIAKHNQLYQQGIVTFKLGMNKYGDMLSHEFVSVMNGYKKSNRTRVQNGSTYLSPMNVAVPESADWRAQGYVTPVKDQGQCGSCWSFSATGSLEGQHFRKSGTLVSLSEQNLVDCSGKFGNSGCNGGLMDNAFAYIKSNNGLDTEDSYPYEAKEGQCRFQSSSVGAEDTGFVDLPTGDEDKLKEASATIGPISIAIDASHESFQFYSKGVYTEPECSSQELDHGVLLVGYGTEKATDSKEHDYWLVKNSWGTTWGEQGYIKMARNRSNQCGVATQASYPLV